MSPREPYEKPEVKAVKVADLADELLEDSRRVARSVEDLVAEAEKLYFKAKDVSLHAVAMKEALVKMRARARILKAVVELEEEYGEKPTP
jgi:hypothetical protein